MRYLIMVSINRVLQSHPSMLIYLVFVLKFLYLAAMENEETSWIKGRGAQKHTANKFHQTHQVREHWEAIDEQPDDSPGRTQYLIETAKSIVNKVASPDVGPAFSLNAYQGCEHGCIYCYARNSHEYWGYNAALDFESKIIVKLNAPALLEQYLNKRGYSPTSIMLSGNTDCYQPAEKQYKLTRQLLEVFLKYRHPVGLLTKNALILRDLDILQELAKRNLVVAGVSITTLTNELHHKMEPRTAIPQQRLKVVAELTKHGIPTFVMNAPIIPGLNDHEMPAIIQAAAGAGALDIHYTMVRLNGSIAEIFRDWIPKAYPLQAEKVLHRIEDCHQGKLNDSRFGKRMGGDGEIADMINGLFKINKSRYFAGRSLPTTDTGQFRVPDKHGQLDLFG